MKTFVKVPLSVILGMLICVAECGLSIRKANNEKDSSLKFSGAHFGNVVAAAVRIVEDHLLSCHLLVVSSHHSRILMSFLRALAEAGAVVMVAETESYDSYETHCQKISESEKDAACLRRKLRRPDKLPCQALVLDYSSGNHLSIARFLSFSMLWLQPGMRVIVMGSRSEVSFLFHHSALRNTRHAVYLTPCGHSSDETRRGAVNIYGRCTHCNEGKAGVQLIQSCREHKGLSEINYLFKDNPGGFNGYRFNVVAMEYFPYISYDRYGGMSGTAVNLTDSLNLHMITALASHLNFTYQVREPNDGLWGLEADGGNWTGIVGTLQHEKADFSMDLTLTRQRAEVIEFCRVYIDEDIIIMSPKPRPLPEYLSLFRPFEGSVWALVVLTVIVWSVVLWFSVYIQEWISSDRSFGLTDALFYGWGLLLEDHPFKPPSKIIGKVLVGKWLIACLILRAAYMSSLISHLVVQGKSSAINTMEELVEHGKTHGTEWGTWNMEGALNTLLSTSPYPAFLVIKHHMQVMDPNAGMKKILASGFSYICNYYVAITLVTSYYNKLVDGIPVHISTTKYPLFAGNTWAFRPGMPSKKQFDRAIQHLLDSGLISYWMNNVIEEHSRKKRLQVNNPDAAELISPLNTIDQAVVVLGLPHLQATFYAMFLCYATALIALFIEHVFHHL